MKPRQAPLVLDLPVLLHLPMMTDDDTGAVSKDVDTGAVSKDVDTGAVSEDEIR